MKNVQEILPRAGIQGTGLDWSFRKVAHLTVNISTNIFDIIYHTILLTSFKYFLKHVTKMVHKKGNTYLTVCVGKF